MGALELVKPPTENFLTSLPHSARHLQYKNRFRQVISSRRILELRQRRKDSHLPLQWYHRELSKILEIIVSEVRLHDGNSVRGATALLRSAFLAHQRKTPPFATCLLPMTCVVSVATRPIEFNSLDKVYLLDRREMAMPPKNPRLGFQGLILSNRLESSWSVCARISVFTDEWLIDCPSDLDFSLKGTGIFRCQSDDVHPLLQRDHVESKETSDRPLPSISIPKMSHSLVN